MVTYVPMFVILLIWVAIWIYLYSLDRKVKDLEKNAK